MLCLINGCIKAEGVALQRAARSSIHPRPGPKRGAAALGREANEVMIDEEKWIKSEEKRETCFEGSVY
jgi:hypothetical protein